jgi:hypothetical protein
MAYKEIYWHSDRNDVPIGDGPLLVRDTRAYQQYTRARDLAHVLQILRTTRDPAIYEHAGDAPVTLYFVIERITDEGRRAVLKRNLAWITRFLAREAGEAGEAVDAESMLVLSGSKRGKALYHVLVPSLYIADEDARTGLSRALRAYKQLEASDVDAEAYGRCAMLRTIWSSEFGARCVVRPIEDSEFRPDDEAYLIHNIRADARPLRLAAQLAKPIPTAVAEAVAAAAAVVEDTKRGAVETVAAVEAVAAVEDTKCGAGHDTPPTPTAPTAPTIGQTVVLLGKMQESIGRLIESPGGAWDTIENLGDIARALRTAASKHPAALSIAKEMLDQLVAASTMCAHATQIALRRFECTECTEYTECTECTECTLCTITLQPTAPLATLSRFVETPEAKLRAWVEGNYVRVPLRDKDSGTKLEALFGAYTAAVPPVHTPLLGRNKFAAMLCEIRPDIGPHKSKNGNVGGLYLLRSMEGR